MDAQKYISEAKCAVKALNDVLLEPTNRLNKDQIAKLIPKSNDLMGVIGQMAVKMAEMEGELTAYKSKNQVMPLYSGAVKKHEPVVIIKPKQKDQENPLTQKEIKNNIDPAKAEVVGIRSSKQGSIIIQCKNAGGTKQMADEINSKWGDKYEAKIPKPKYPTIKIIGLTEKYSSDEIQEKIKNQNKFLDTEKCNIKVTYIKEVNYRNKISYVVFAGVDGDSYQKMIKEEKISIGWDRCRVFDNLNIMRCFKCNGFNHKALDCRNQTSCPKCAKQHNIKECTEDGENDMQCINCIMTSKSLGLKLNSNHSAMSKDCPVYKRKVEMERSKIDFLG